MNSFIVSVQAVIPMFSMMLIGSMVKKFKLLNEIELLDVNNLVFRVFLPFLLFKSVCEADISKAVDTKLLFFGITAVIIVYAGAVFITIMVEKNNASRGAMIQAIYRSNFVIMGLPIVSNIYGSQELGIAAVMITVIVPIYNILAVITLETFRGSKIEFKKIIIGIFENPLIIGAMLGMIVVFLNIRFPLIIMKTIGEISAVATPLALVVMGASFKLSSIDKSRRNLAICVVGRLIIVPGFCLSAAALAGFRDVAFVTLIGLFSAPCAISSFTMAQQMDSDAELAGNAVVITSAVASFTMFMWIFVFKQLGMF